MYERILVPVDGSATSKRGLDEAVRLAKLTNATIKLLHVVDELVFATGFETGATYSNVVLPLLKEGGERILAEARERVAAAQVPVETLLVDNIGARTAEVVVEQADAWKADVIVLGTHGRRGVTRFMLGSDAEQILRLAKVPVLLVRAAEDEEGRIGTAADTAATMAARIATVAA